MLNLGPPQINLCQWPVIAACCGPASAPSGGMAVSRSVFTLQDLQNWPQADLEGIPPARLAVIGDPVAHSKSPQMHNPALVAAGKDASYIRVHVLPGQVRAALELFRQNGFWGVNVTIPHKLEALEAVEEVDPLAKTLGAVNTVAIKPECFRGYNTDGPGFLNAVRQAFSKELVGLRVLILGAGGGAGRAVAVQCALAGAAEVVLVNRTQAKSEELASALHAMNQGTSASAVVWSDEALRRVLPEMDLIVNGSPLGMKEGDPPLIPADALRSEQMFFDMAYRADGGVTSLGESARAVGGRYTDGAMLLLHQGALSYEHWFIEPAPIEAMSKGLASALDAARRA
jgi:shikimate dehydrogenase